MVIVSGYWLRTHAYLDFFITISRLHSVRTSTTWQRVTYYCVTEFLYYACSIEKTFLKEAGTRKHLRNVSSLRVRPERVKIFPPLSLTLYRLSKDSRTMFSLYRHVYTLTNDNKCVISRQGYKWKINNVGKHNTGLVSPLQVTSQYVLKRFTLWYKSVCCNGKTSIFVIVEKYTWFHGHCHPSAEGLVISFMSTNKPKPID